MPYLSTVRILYTLLPVTKWNKLANQMNILYKLVFFIHVEHNLQYHINRSFKLNVKIEHKIARKNGKISYHLQKWKTLNEILYN